MAEDKVFDTVEQQKDALSTRSTRAAATLYWARAGDLPGEVTAPWVLPGWIA
jgi:hypothetical protein